MLYGLAGFLKCKLTVYDMDTDEFHSYLTTEYEGAAHIVIINEFGVFSGSQSTDGPPIEFESLSSLVPFHDPESYPPPPIPQWTCSTQGMEDNNSNRQDVTVYRYGTAGDLMVCSLNVNGMNEEKFGDILWWMGAQHIDVLCCQDARLDNSEAQIYNDKVHSLLGAQAKCFIDPGKCEGTKKCRVGGQLTIISHLWGSKCSFHAPDPTNHGVLASVVIDLVDDSKLLIISTYWPTKAPPGDKRPGRLWNRLLQHLQDKRKQMTPLEYICAEIEIMTTSHMGKGGNSTILCGDFNAAWFNKKASHSIKEWAEENLWMNALATHTRARDRPTTYWHNPATPTSWIDHVLWHQSSTVQCTGGGVMYGPFWTTVSDHRPIFGCFAGKGLQRYQTMNHAPRHMPSVLRKITLSNLQENRTKFHKSMSAIVESLPVHQGAQAAGDILQDICNRTVLAVPNRPLKELYRSTFKDCWSPYAVAGKTHLKAIVAIRRHLQGVKKTHRWRDADEATIGIKHITDAWIKRVQKLKWKDNVIPAEVWGLGLTPSEWCTQPFHRKHLLEHCRTNFALVRHSLHARRRKQESAKISHAVWKREQKLEERKLGDVIASMLGKRHHNFCIEALDLPPIVLASGEKAQMTSAQAHQYVTEHICEQYQLVQSLQHQPDMIQGDVEWEEGTIT